MVKGQFRHLPVKNSNNEVVSLIDITKCLIDALDRLEKQKRVNQGLNDAIKQAQKVYPPEKIKAAEALYKTLLAPTLNDILISSSDTPTSPITDPISYDPTISITATVLDACKLMQKRNLTGIVILNGSVIAGIFTSKDLVLRVLASNLDPKTTLLLNVMTPKPETATRNTTIYEALRIMHFGRFLHLPIINPESGKLEGLVDVLKLTYSIIDQLAVNDSMNTIWSGFWDHASEISSRSRSRRNSITPPSMSQELYPDDSASIIRVETRVENSSNLKSMDFVFKFTDPFNGRTFKIKSSLKFETLVFKIKEKIGSRYTSKNVYISYVDDEGDLITISNTLELENCISDKGSNGKMDLILKFESFDFDHYLVVGVASVCLVLAFVVGRIYQDFAR